MRESKKSKLKSQKRICIRVLIFTFYFLISNYSSIAQKVTTTIDRDKILLGEQIELQLKIELNSSGTLVDEWFNLPDTFNHMEIVKRLPIDTLQIQGQQVYFKRSSLRRSIPVILVSRYSTVP